MLNYYCDMEIGPQCNITHHDVADLNGFTIYNKQCTPVYIFILHVTKD